MAKKKASRKKASKKKGVQGLMDEMFQAAVALRGSIETPDYKRYVLPLIFLRFLSLKYERRREELEAQVADPTHDLYEASAEERKALLEDADLYEEAQTFIVPEQARWSNLVAQAQQDDIKVKVDEALAALEDAYPERLRGLLPQVFATSNMKAETLAQLIALFSKDIFKDDHGTDDLIGRIYEYFIGEFASSEGKRGGEYFTPSSIVKTLVAMLEPQPGSSVFDPCCGSGGMFVQSDIFTGHGGGLSFYGQEEKEFTYRLCRMNLFIHGIEGKVERGSSYTEDKHPTLKADYIIANPPFNDGAKGENGWGADQIPDKDPRLMIGGSKMPLAVRNANPMWMMHFLHHLADGGSAGFVMATGELSNGEIARLDVRKALVDADHVDCIVALSGQLFANTQIPCSLWFLSKSRDGSDGRRKREGEVLFIDGRKLGSLIEGSKTQRELSSDEIERIAAAYREFKREKTPETINGFVAVATTAEISENRYALTPGRYVGSEDVVDDDEPFDVRFPALMEQLSEQLDTSHRLGELVQKALREVTGG